MSLPLAWIRRGKSSANGASVSFANASPALTRSHEAGGKPAFPPNVVVEVKRIACELPAAAGLPFARWSLPELRREVLARGLVAMVSGTTIWRWLDADAIRPWRHRSWLFPRDPRFAERAGPILDLYQSRWDGQPLGPHDYVISADEKTSIQARQRRTPRRQRRRAERCEWSTNTTGVALGPISPRGMSIAHGSLAGVRRARELRPLTVLLQTS